MPDLYRLLILIFISIRVSNDIVGTIWNSFI